MRSQRRKALFDQYGIFLHLSYWQKTVTTGKFLHTDEFLFGPALVEAYLLESRAANYPRVILDRNVIKAGARSHSAHHSKKQEEAEIMDLLERDSDGMYYVDYFYKARGELDDAAYGFPDYIGKLGDIIRRGLMASGHPSKADLRVKFYWMRERYNKMVELVSKPAYVEGLRLDGEDLLADVYKGLRKIGH